MVVFAPDAANVYLARQKEVVASEGAAFRERDVAVVYVIGDTVSQQFGPAPGADASALRAKYGIKGDEFDALLIGKDGG